jgi:hypothetical protein
MLSRRTLFKTLFSAALVAPLARFVPLSAAMTDKIKSKLLDIKSKTAVRLHYVAKAEDAKKGASKAKYKEGSNCENCNFYKAKKPNLEWGRCSMAANKYVSKDGWCKSYRAKKKKKA